MVPKWKVTLAKCRLQHSGCSVPLLDCRHRTFHSKYVTQPQRGTCSLVGGFWGVFILFYPRLSGRVLPFLFATTRWQWSRNSCCTRLCLKKDQNTMSSGGSDAAPVEGYARRSLRTPCLKACKVMLEEVSEHRVFRWI